jgi:hypothetical protein|tara:strand:+ start:307 stop:492 length:186 start_codon:yes stop_codon:yes gene_type:complete
MFELDGEDVDWCKDGGDAEAGGDAGEEDVDGLEALSVYQGRLFLRYSVGALLEVSLVCQFV